MYNEGLMISGQKAMIYGKKASLRDELTGQQISLTIV